MKVLFFTKYTRQGASSRLRTYQYLPFYLSKGVVFKVSPLFDDNYLYSIYNKKPVSRLKVIRSYLNRLLQLFFVWRYDVVVIEKELFPYLPAFAERTLAFFGVKYIVDYDDAIFHNYDAHANKHIRLVLKRKIAEVMKHAALVVAGNAYLCDYAVKAGAKRIVVIPTVIDTERYSSKPVEKPDGILTIGWIGSPSTLQYLYLIKPVLEELSVQYPIKLAIVGGKSGIGLKGHEEVIEWTEDSEIGLIQEFDIGIMPLKNELWELGKCGYKLIQYMGCGVPVIGSPVGANNVIIEEGENGYKPTDLEAWKDALTKLLNDPRLRNQMGRKGREMVEKHYSLKVARQQWLDNLLATA